MSHAMLAAIARRYDTVMSRAMLRALGVPFVSSAALAGSAVRADRRYEGMLWCFENHGSPMDAVR